MNLARKTMPISHCRSCGAEVLFLKHAETGKVAPITTKPSPDGNVVVDYAAGTYRIAPKKERCGPLHLNHFANCPRASRHHKKEAP